MTRLIVTIDADLTEDRNTYKSGDDANIAEAIARHVIHAGADVYVEFGATGDVVSGSLVRIEVPHTPDVDHINGAREALLAVLEAVEKRCEDGDADLRQVLADVRRIAEDCSVELSK